MSNYVSWIVIGLSVGAAACGDVREETESPFARSPEPITGGRLVTSTGHKAPDTSVVRLELTSAGGFEYCTALKVSPRVFWAAAHCLNGVSRTATVRITNTLDGNFSYTTSLTGYDLHPSYWNYMRAPDILKNYETYDVARITTAGDSPSVPVYSTTHSTWIGPGASVTYTGYGCDFIDPSHSGKKQYDFFQLVDEATLGPVAGLTSDEARAYYIRNMAAVGSDPEGCKGDSGAPLFQKIDSVWKVIGTVVHGEGGYTGFARYSNIRNWLAAPAYNQFQIGFQGFLLNRITGRCISGLVSTLYDLNCDGREQDTDVQSWKLQQSGGAGDMFYIINGKTAKCLDLDTTAVGSLIVQRPCNPISLGVNTQRWKFEQLSSDENYRHIKNVQTGHCIVPEAPNHSLSSVLRSTTCSGSSRSQSFVMTR